MAESNSESSLGDQSREQVSKKDRPVSHGRNRTSLKTRAQKTVVTIAAATELLSLLPSPTSSRDHLGPIWNPPLSSTLLNSNAKIPTFNPQDYDLSPQGLPPKNNGEVKTPYGTFPIEGMSVIVDPSRTVIPPDTIIKVVTIEPPDGDLHSKKSQWQEGGSEVIGTTGNYLRDAQIETDKVLGIENSDSWDFPEKNDELPISGDEGGYLSVQLFNKKTGDEESTTLYPEIFSKDEPTAFGDVIMSEVNSPKIVNEIKQTLALFRPFLRHKLRFVIHKESLPNPILWNEFQPPDETIQLAEPEFKSKNGYDLNSEIRYHELVHAIYDGLDGKAKQQLLDAYKTIIGNMQYRMPTNRELLFDNYDILANEPIWAVITESTYNTEAGLEGTIIGHPFSNQNESFASTINVLRRFSNLFLEKYSQLQENQRFAICNFVVAAINSIRSVNPDKADMEKLIPDLPIVLKTFDADSANESLGDQLEALINET